MKILLDIDGVMVPAASWKPLTIMSDGFTVFARHAISNLEKIIAHTDASIVLTSSHKSSYSLSEWKNIFHKRGINAPIEKLEDNLNYLSRKEEIEHWLEKNPEERFVIIDDDKSLNDLPASFKEHLVLTSALVGLTDDHAASAIQILKADIASA